MKELLKVKDLEIFFGDKKVVDSINFDVNEGETLAILGESGSGKSVTCLSLTRLLPLGSKALINGSINFNGKAILDLKDKELRKVRGGGIAYVFQEPSVSLNPVFTIGFQIAEAVKLHRKNVINVREKVIDLLNMVGIKDAKNRYKSYPHELSGGMQQRVVIAMALACEPKLLVADEPTTALDVTTQNQILDLLKDLRKKIGMSIIIITHNFGVIRGFADRVLVMYKGEIVESGNVEDVLNNPKHNYTKALISCIPKLGDNRERLITIEDQI